MNTSIVPHNPQSTAETRMNALVPKSINEALTLAEVMASASLMPDHLRGKPGDCLLIVMQAQRWGMDAVSVAQCTSVVHGKLCYEGKLVAAALYSMGAIDGRLHYEIKGSGANASITVIATPRGGTGPQSVAGSVKDWRTFGKDKGGNRIDNAWDKMPEDMLVYRGTRQWARRYAPDALLGVYTPDELEDAVIDATVVSIVAKPALPAQLQPYSAEQFEKNLPVWRDLIASGKKSADNIIATVSSKGVLSAEQIATIKGETQRVEDALPADEAEQDPSQDALPPFADGASVPNQYWPDEPKEPQA